MDFETPCNPSRSHGPDKTAGELFNFEQPPALQKPPRSIVSVQVPGNKQSKRSCQNSHSVVRLRDLPGSLGAIAYQPTHRSSHGINRHVKLFIYNSR